MKSLQKRLYIFAIILFVLGLFAIISGSVNQPQADAIDEIAIPLIGILTLVGGGALLLSVLLTIWAMSLSTPRD